jgi:rare lipoprotein A
MTASLKPARNPLQPACATARRVFSRPSRLLLCVLLAALAVTSACGRRRTRVSTPRTPLRVGQTEEGIASWYGPPYHGRHAANGEIYDMNQLTAAHRTLPFDTRVRVTNLENSKRVEVRITDRGPFVKGRVIDLSRAAAYEIGMLLPGTARVRLEIRALPDPRAPRTTRTVAPPPATTTATEPPAAATPAPAIAPPQPAGATTAQPAAPPPPPSAHAYCVQAGAFRNRDSAERLRASLDAEFPPARIEESLTTPTVYRVIVGAADTVAEAEALAARVRVKTGDAIVVNGK